jgi:hypothetical protein
MPDGEDKPLTISLFVYKWQEKQEKLMNVGVFSIPEPVTCAGCGVLTNLK